MSALHLCCFLSQLLLVQCVLSFLGDVFIGASNIYMIGRVLLFYMFLLQLMRWRFLLSVAIMQVHLKADHSLAVSRLFLLVYSSTPHTNTLCCTSKCMNTIQCVLTQTAKTHTHRHTITASLSCQYTAHQQSGRW